MGYKLELQSECLRNHCAFFNSLTLLHKCFDVLRNLSSLLRLRDHHVLMNPKLKFLLTTYSEINFQLEICIMDLFLLLVTSGKALFFAAQQPVPCRAVPRAAQRLGRPHSCGSSGNNPQSHRGQCRALLLSVRANCLVRIWHSYNVYCLSITAAWKHC